MHVEILHTADASSHKQQLLNELYRLRAKVFAQRLGWDVEVKNGEETDEYDLLQPTYLAVLDDGRVVGGARLLPATGPTMVTHTFAFLLEEGRGLGDPITTIESSRFCIDTDAAAEVAGTGLHQATHTLFAALLEWSIQKGFSTIATVTDVRFERLLRRTGWPLARLGAPRRVGDTIAVAGLLPANLESLERVKLRTYRPIFPQLCAVP
ncbi:MAG: acyl-homoserine-lactone synthase [Pseudorhizobium sp.]